MNIIFYIQLMVSGHFGQIAPNVTSRVVREGNYEQEDVQIQCSRIKEGIVFGKYLQSGHCSRGNCSSI
jgi:hypothetical protein